MVVGDQGADGFVFVVPGEPPEVRVEARVPQQPRAPGLEGLAALAEVVPERVVHHLVHGVLVDVEPEAPDLQAARRLRHRRLAGEVDGHAVDGAPELVAVPAQQVPLGVVRGDAEDVQAHVLVAALQCEPGRAPLGEPQQPPAELRLVVVRVDPEVGLQLAGAELVTGVGVADQTTRPFGDPGVMPRVEAFHRPVVLEILERAVRLSRLRHVAGVEEVDDLRGVSPRGGPDAARCAQCADGEGPVLSVSAFIVLRRRPSPWGRSDRSPAPRERSRRCAG